MSTFFGPLDKTSCIYFLIVTGFFLALLIFAVFGNVYWLLLNYKELNFRLLSGGLIMLFNIFIAYFVNRLLYTMCTKSLA